MLDPAENEIIWHRRAAGGGLEPPLTVREGLLHLDPPGIEVHAYPLVSGGRLENKMNSMQWVICLHTPRPGPSP